MTRNYPVSTCIDPKRMRIFKNAVCVRFKISPLHWDEFFSTCLHRSLTQMLCDVRGNYKFELEQQQQSNSQTVRLNADVEAHHQQQADDSLVETDD